MAQHEVPGDAVSRETAQVVGTPNVNGASRPKHAAATGTQDGQPADTHVNQVRNAHWDLDLLTPDDVCILLKVKKSWLYDTVETGALEAIRLGKQLRFQPSAIARYLEERAGSGNRA
jgi:excisionase family DNA binding protein